MSDIEKVICLSKRLYRKKIGGVLVNKDTCGHFIGMFRKGDVDSWFYCPTCGSLWHVKGNEKTGYEMKENKRGKYFNTETSPKVVER